MMALELLFYNGDVQTVPPGYVLNPATDREVRTQNGMTILVVIPLLGVGVLRLYHLPQVFMAR
jgi:hypothetical protein